MKKRFQYRSGLYLSFLLIIIIPIFIEFILFRRIILRNGQNEFYAEARTVSRGILDELDRNSRILSELSHKYVQDRRIINCLISGQRKNLE